MQPSRRAADSDKAKPRTEQGRRARGCQHDWWSPWRTTGAETARRCAAADRRARAPGTTARVRGRRTTRQRPVVHSLQRGSPACARGATAGRARGPILRLRGSAPRGRAHRQAEREHVVTNASLPVPPHPGGATERPAGTNALTITNGASRLPRRPRPLNVNCAGSLLKPVSNAGNRAASPGAAHFTHRPRTTSAPHHQASASHRTAAKYYFLNPTADTPRSQPRPCPTTDW